MKFDHVKNETGTVIVMSFETKFGEYDVLYQQWIWDGIKAMSLIFDNNDIAVIELSLLIGEVRNSSIVSDNTQQLTSSSEEQYTFINFNFEII
jgi:hypothetical protein